MPRKSWFSINAKAGAAEIYIYDEIGYFGVTASDFARELKALGDVKSILLRINSPGGNPFDAMAMHSLLTGHPAEVTGRVDGLAASAASIALMGADHIVMPENSLLMIHDPWGVAAGGAEDMRDMAEVLDKLATSLVNLYAARSGKDAAEVRKLMAEETWMTGTEAKAAGFCDETEAPLKVAASADPARFRNAPASLSAEPQRSRQPSPDEIAEREQAAAIADMCCKAGDLRLAVGFIEAGLSIADVEGLLAERAEEAADMDERLARSRAYRAAERSGRLS